MYSTFFKLQLLRCEYFFTLGFGQNTTSSLGKTRQAINQLRMKTMKMMHKIHKKDIKFIHIML